MIMVMIMMIFTVLMTLFILVDDDEVKMFTLLILVIMIMGDDCDGYGDVIGTLVTRTARRTTTAPKSHISGLLFTFFCESLGICFFASNL